MNNTFQHISNKAEYVYFDSKGTNFPTTVTNVQAALALTGPVVRATEKVFGTVKLATTDQTLAGTDDTTAITPLKLKMALEKPDATTTQKGIIQIATNAEALSGTITTKAIVPSSLKYTINDWFTKKIATESVLGVIKLSTQAGAAAGVDNTTAMTPLRVKQAIAAATAEIPSYSPASETVSGLTKLATVGQMEQGTLRTGVAVSPYSLAQLTGNESRRGIVQAATLAQANVGTDKTLYISAFGFKNYNANTTNYGTVKLTDTPGTSGNGIALSSTAKVVRLTANNQTITGNIDVVGDIKRNGKSVLTEVGFNDHMPIGAVIMWTSTTMPSDKWEVADGGAKSKSSNPLLFDVLKYTYGGSGDTYNKPDMRGLFVRGVGTSTHIEREKGQDRYGKNKLGAGVNGGTLGEVQKQQLIYHKHASGWGEREKNYALYGCSSTYGFFGNGSRSDWDNSMYYTNAGHEVDPPELWNERSKMNPTDLMGNENRPWNMSLIYIIKVA